MIMQNAKTKCPICKFSKALILLNLNCGNFDNSALYKLVKIIACEKCGHVYNKLSSREITGLAKYYNEEYAPANVSSTDKVGDRPGSKNTFTLRRHARLYRLFAPFIKNDFRVLDVGCATGGFLDFLSARRLKKLYGIDISLEYVKKARENGVYDIRTGDAELIPFADASMDLVVLDQVLEHLGEPQKAIKEARRVLSDGGLLCISVPDAARYEKEYFFDFYWFLIKEHIQHFDIEHLRLLAAREGFELVAESESTIPMTSKKMVLPVLSAVFRLVGGKGMNTIKTDKLEKQIKRYITNDFKKLGKKRKMIESLSISRKPIYAWGTGREFLYLYESCGLNKCNLAGLIDTNSYKQKTNSIGGTRIQDKSILTKATPDSALIISAPAHAGAIKAELAKIGYHGRIIEV